MKAPEKIETARLVIRRPARADAAAMFARYAGDAEVTRYLGWPRHASAAETEAFVGVSDTEWVRWPAGPYLLFDREDGALLGGTGLSFETAGRASTGYVLARDAWGRGIATEALGAMVDLAPKLGLARLYALCHPDHRASWRVMEKCGFELEGTLRRHTVFPNLKPGEAADVLCYARVWGGQDARGGLTRGIVHGI
jgi:[ribosomal protein S5]-alanine N-acetyltransferase